VIEGAPSNPEMDISPSALRSAQTLVDHEATGVRGNSSLQDTYDGSSF
jgi:hypothetical protein